ncbi:MAG: DUF3320 domain-containing protein [Bryobacteraceae bacterium]
MLDLTKSNPLIGLNRSRVSKLQVIKPEGDTLFARFVVEQNQLRMPLVRKRAGQPEQPSLLQPDQDPDLVVEPGDVTFDAKPLDIMRRLRRIRDNARTTMEERGVTTLYLTFGALRWKDELLGDSVSPLWMVPCEFEEKGPDAPLRLCPADEDSQINPALECYLRERHKIELPDIPEEADAQALAETLRHVRLAVQEQKWEVTNEVWLSTLSFESLVIYRDLRALTDLAAANPTVVALSRASAAAGKSEALPQGLDSLPTPATVPIPVLPTDSSQLEALTQSALGRHVVVHGPPGTGKSQTIANLIVDALARNKKVLFVSAKMAALNVVYERLKELGLQRFCLEAHSTKAGKQKIIDELRRTLEAETAYDGDALDRELQALLRVREELNAYARELHTPVQPLGLSVFRANARLAQIWRFADVCGPLPWPNPLDASRDKLDECIRALEELAANSETFDQGTAHPWYGFAPTTFGVAEQESLASCFKALAEFNRKVTPAADTLECLIPGARLLSIHEWNLLKAALGAIAETDRLPKGWWEKSDAELSKLAQLFADAAGRRDELDRLVGEIEKSIKGALEDVAGLLGPAEDRFKGWHSILRPGYWRWRKDVQAHLLCEFTRARVATLCAQCRRALEIEHWFTKHRPQIAHYLEPGVAETSGVLRGISQSFTAASLLKRGLALVGKDALPALSINVESRNAAKGIPDQISNAIVVAAVHRLDSDWPLGFVRDMIASRAPLPELFARAATLLASMQRARERVLLNRALQQCASLGLSPFLASFGSESAADAPQMFERRFLNLWLSTAIDRSQALSEFTEAKGNNLLEKFRNLDARVRQLAVGRAQMTASAASARVRAAEEIPENASEVGILRRELQKRKRIKPLRKLFAEIPHVLQALKPCLLMSPISVSTYLRPDVFHFDLVVFDEASQLPTAEAIPAVLRSSQVVVAGDPKQLPPTSFFEASLTTEEEEEDDDGASGQVPLESFLDDCVAVVPVFQEVHLRWHYRSRDERLIKFSNHFFYDNRLITFPAANPNAAAQGVRFVHVKEGVYDRGRSRTNRLEARAVATLAREHFECHPERSLGIVALNLSQKEAIEDAISELKLDRPDLAPFFDHNRDSTVFVKSLENVQGDERDTMIISVGYGRNQAGGFTMNFGPIVRDGGWRRLNVLVTRARWECILVASVRALDFANVNPNNRGAVALRDFLEFSERNGELPAEVPVLTNAETNEFEEAVRAALIDRGLKVDMQVGASRYRIDLAVRDPRDDRRYLLGIECDGATYHSARNARDRDLLRQLVLQRMGWRIHRVWSTEWFHDREQAIGNIFRSVEQAQRTPITHAVYAPPTSTPSNPEPRAGSQPASELPRQYKAGIPYSVYQPSRRLSRDHLLDASHTRTLSRTIADVVKIEGPIHREMVIERLKQIHNVARMGSNVQANIERALRDGETSRTIARDPRLSFYYEPGHQLESFRLPVDSVRRPIEYIAPTEIALAILYLVEDQFGVIEESLPQAVARLFGIDRLRAEGADQIRAVIEDLVAKGSLRRAGIQVHLA